MNTPRLRRNALALAITTFAIAAIACGSSAHSAGATSRATSARSAPAGSPAPFPVVTASVIGSTQPDEISALAASGDRVWLAVDDAILESSDDGAHWRQASTIAGGADSLSFISANEGWAGTPTGLLHTTDGGATWAPLPVASDDAILRMRFVDAEHGWIDQRDTGLERTTDGGTTWTLLPSPCQLASRHGVFVFINPNDGWLMCNGQGAGTTVEKQLYRTRDGGQTWALLSQWQFGQATPSPYPPPGDGGTVDMFFLDASHGWTADDIGGVDATVDGARTWGRTTFDKAGDPAADGVMFVSQTQGYAFVARSFVSATVDGGKSWNVIYALPQTAPPSSAHTLSSIGIKGQTQQWSTLLPGFDVWAQATHNGEIWILAEQCTEEALPPGKGDSNSRTFKNCGQMKLLRSEDGGRSWTQYELPGIDLQDVFVTASGVLRVDAGRAVFEASDGGRTWTRVRAPLVPSITPAPSG